MLSSRIHRNYTMDRENVVVIEVNDPSMFEREAGFDAENAEEAPELTPEEQAALIVKAAQEEAERILTDAAAAGVAEQAALRTAAKSEIAVLKEQAKTEGYQKGIKDATQEGDAIRAQARQILADAQAERKAMQEKLEPEMVDLLISITQKLIGNVVQLNPDTILTLVRMGMQNATITGHVTIYVSSDDFATVSARKDDIMALTDGSVKLDIVKDLSLNPMDCVIETPFGNIDCSLGQQLESLCHNIAYLLNG